MWGSRTALVPYLTSFGCQEFCVIGSTLCGAHLLLLGFLFFLGFLPGRVGFFRIAFMHIDIDYLYSLYIGLV